MTPDDERHLRTAIEVARRAREHGNHPFGAVLVDAQGGIVLEAENTVVTDRDVTAHAELNLIREASARFEPDFLAGCTLYASTEPCGMCAGAIYWGNVRRVVFALGSATFRSLADPEDAGLLIPSRDVLGRGGHGVVVGGPHLEDEGLVVHEGFWAGE
jgi:tRNA(Arg) A34 adenosine deaminase TadA